MVSTRRTLLTGFALILVFFGAAFLLWAGSYLPGFVGQTFRFVAGLVSTPFFMEGSIAIVGTFLVIALNSYRRQNEGDDYMTIEVDDEDGTITVLEEKGRDDSSRE